MSASSPMRTLPKVELHAHLNGCVRDSTLLHFARQAGRHADDDSVLQRCRLSAAAACAPAADAARPPRRKPGPGRSLDECFALFGAIHELVRDAEALGRIAAEAMQDMDADGVAYAEWRTTPKVLGPDVPSAAAYVRTVRVSMAEALRHTQTLRHAGLILSINRAQDGAAAMQTVMLAHRLMGQQSRGDGRGDASGPHGAPEDREVADNMVPVVGVDLSGNPRAGTDMAWMDALKEAVRLGIPLMLHVAEVFAPAETMALLALGPRRVGHFCFADDACRRELLRCGAALELCLTSNMLTMSTPSLPEHHFGQYFDQDGGVRVALCTDDSAVFGTTLTHEFELAQQHLGLSLADAARVCCQALDASMAPKHARQHVLRLLRQWCTHNDVELDVIGPDVE